MKLPSMQQLQGKWRQQIGAAKIAWGDLTEDPQLIGEGQDQRLAGLLQERYALSREEADAQVKAFLEKNLH
ncbi:CsbD family protein [Pseudomonas sp. CAU 1711]|uniref:CsbD family protein n=1 Tax=Pseudomonas sp. CAU 1711 TaxID=3140356 RepID=UPI00325FEC28